jgi:hypothetical protein
MKFTSAPTAPMASGEIPSTQLSGVLAHLGARDEEPALEPEDVDQREQQAGEHAEMAPGAVRALVEDAHHQRREDGRGGQAEGQGHHLGREARWIHAQVAGHDDGAGHGDAAGHELAFSEIPA